MDYTILAAEITDGTLWQAVAGMGAFMAALVMWVLKDAKAQRKESRESETEKLKIEREKLKAQYEMNGMINKLSDTLKDHMDEENERSVEMKTSIDRLCKTNEKLTDTITRSFLQKVG